MKRYKTVVRAFVVSAVFTFLCTLPEQSQAFSIITFDLRNGPEGIAVDGLEEGTVTKDGLTVTLEANSGVLNQTGSAFGINALGSSDASHLIDYFDNGEGLDIKEFVTIKFDQLVTLDQLVLSSFTTSETAILTIADSSSISLDGTTPAKDVYDFSTDIIPIGQSVILEYSAGNGFSFDEFTVTTTVPEPATIALLGIGLAILGTGYLWRRKRTNVIR